MHAVHDKLEAGTLWENVAFDAASPGRKVTDNIPQVGSTRL
jgi:hypothetical protein